MTDVEEAPDVLDISLTELIENIKDKIKRDDHSLTTIKSPMGLLVALEKLKEVIGMERLKRSIARQTNFLMAKLEDGDFEMTMLNTVLYGAPGVGKTKMGLILAEIWDALGFLEKAVEQNTVPTNPMLDYLDGHPEYLQVTLLASVMLWGWFISLAKWCFKNTKALILISSLILAAVLFWTLWVFYQNNTSDLNPEGSRLGAPTEPVKIASRSDFVGQYVGWTDPKTKKFLNDNLGKVIFVDECYSLCNDARDTFGMEALTSINQYMSEHPEAVFIFAGYEDKINNGIFVYQKGLPRRFMWKFKCDEYDGEDLSKIFLLQLSKKKLKLSEEDEKKVIKHIIDNSAYFPAFGGDTERLVFFTQLNQASRKDRKTGLVTFEDVSNGVEELRMNSIKNAAMSSNEDIMSNLVNAMTRPKVTVDDDVFVNC